MENRYAIYFASLGIMNSHLWKAIISDHYDTLFRYFTIVQ